MTHQEVTTKAFQGIDTKDFLNHIAWTDILLPELLKAKEFYTKELVASVLETTTTKTTKEQIAGRIFGIDFIIKVIDSTLRNGKVAEDILADKNYHLQ